jgi:hypothetical protein
MRRTWPLAVAFVAALLTVPFLMHATPGTFRGVVIHGPDIEPGWIIVKSANGVVRKVGISRAKVEYSDTVPARKRARLPESAVVTGVEVRITADQDSNGEWRATRIEILHLTSDPDIQPSERSDNIRTA